MKKIKLISFVVICLLLFNASKIKALSTASTGVYELFIRTETNSSSTEVFKLAPSTTITLIKDTEISGNGCENNNWFEVEYNTHKGFVCSKYLTNINWENKQENQEGNQENNEPVIDLENIYKEELNKFPDSYKTKIESLHKIYPNAIFKSKNIDLSFNNFASYEYQGYAKNSLNGCPYGINIGISLLEDTSRSRDGLKSLDSWAYNPLTDTFNTNYNGGQINRWYAPSLNTVKYYLDPRNFINERNIFMFEVLTYGGDYYKESDIEKMLAGTFMYKTKVKGKENTTFAKAFIDAGKQNNISPYFLASRVVQEIGANRGSMVSGTWTGYNSAYYGYYNFYNINAAGNSTTETIKNGLAYAKSMGWNNEYSAIVGGGAFISDGYISVGQDTTYLQKFDVYGPCYGMHQYMQNIEAPVSESYKTYNGYNNAGMLDSNFVFVIPVYNNMPESTKLDDARNSNNYLRSLTINGATIEGFNYQKEEYEINVSPLITSVEIAATKASSKSNVVGTGTFNLTSTEQTKEIVVTAENGMAKTYKIKVTKDVNIPISISEILNTMIINSDGTYVSSIALNTKITDFIEKAKEVDTNALIMVKNNKDEEKESEILSTGDKVTITSGEESKTFTVVIYGDINGDGSINSADLLKIRQHLIGTISLTGEFKIAANVTKGEEVINSADLLKIRQHLIGSSLIEQ